MLHLYDDDAHAVKGMIAYLYGLMYDGEGNFMQSWTPTPDLEATRRYMKYQVELFVTASKYQTTYIEDVIKDDFRKHLQSILNMDAFALIADVARHVYIVHEFAAIELRRCIVNALISDQRRNINNVDALVRLRKDVLDFAAEYRLAKAAMIKANARSSVGGRP